MQKISYLTFPTVPKTDFTEHNLNFIEVALSLILNQHNNFFLLLFSETLDFIRDIGNQDILLKKILFERFSLFIFVQQIKVFFVVLFAGNLKKAFSLFIAINRLCAS